MGCGSSRVGLRDAFSGVEQEELLLKYGELQHSLHLEDKEMLDMYKIFAMFDDNRTGVLCQSDWLALFDLERSPLTERLFRMFAGGAEDGVSFKYYLFSTWTFCTQNTASLTSFAFQMYDSRNRGILGAADVMAMMKDLFGVQYEDNPIAQQIMRKLLDKNVKGERTTGGVTQAMFAQLASSAKNLLYRPFQVQHHMQDQVLGRAFWAKKARQRYDMQADGRFDLSAVVEIMNRGKAKSRHLTVLQGVVVPLRTAAGTQESEAEAQQAARQKNFMLQMDEDSREMVKKASSAKMRQSPARRSPHRSASSQAPYDSQHEGTLQTGSNLRPAKVPAHPSSAGWSAVVGGSSDSTMRSSLGGGGQALPSGVAMPRSMSMQVGRHARTAAGHADLEQKISAGLPRSASSSFTERLLASPGRGAGAGAGAGRHVSAAARERMDRNPATKVNHRASAMRRAQQGFRG